MGESSGQRVALDALRGSGWHAHQWVLARCSGRLFDFLLRPFFRTPPSEVSGTFQCRDLGPRCHRTMACLCAYISPRRSINLARFGPSRRCARPDATTARAGPRMTLGSVAYFGPRTAWCEPAATDFGGPAVAIEFKGSH